MAVVESTSPWSSLSADHALGRPLCVDLDGTLVTTDTLWECVVLLIRRRPWLMLLAPLWLLRGRARFKQSIAGHVDINPGTLPYRHDLLEALRASKARGRKLVLATAADRKVALHVASHLALFDDVMSSEGGQNLKAHEKRDRLREAFGEGGYDYVGDSSADLAIFESCGAGYLVGAKRGTAERVRNLAKVSVVSLRPSVARAALKELRLHQWAKNALVVAPVLLTAGLPDPALLLRAVIAAAAFSLSASAGYVFNDLLDLEADRAHETKKNRPLASGSLPVLLGPPLFVVLLAAAFALSSTTLSPSFTLMLGLYFVGTLSYSLYLKKRLLLDVLVLAGLYTHRILSGGVATGVPITAWLLAFSMFLFLSLAFAKRYVELLALTSDKIKNRNYYKADLQMVASMGAASGYIAALVFSLYVEGGGSVQDTYREPALLWLAMPVLLYWISRIWILAGRGQMQDDPVRFAIKDPISLGCGAAIGGIATLARFTPEWLSAALH